MAVMRIPRKMGPGNSSKKLILRWNKIVQFTVEVSVFKSTLAMHWCSDTSTLNLDFMMQQKYGPPLLSLPKY